MQGRFTRFHAMRRFTLYQLMKTQNNACVREHPMKLLQAYQAERLMHVITITKRELGLACSACLLASDTQTRSCLHDQALPPRLADFWCFASSCGSCQKSKGSKIVLGSCTFLDSGSNNAWLGSYDDTVWPHRDTQGSRAATLGLEAWACGGARRFDILVTCFGPCDVLSAVCSFASSAIQGKRIWRVLRGCDC